MARYIDADAALRAYEHLKPDSMKDFEAMIKCVPAADVVLVIRCRDCRWWDEFPSQTAASELHMCKRPFIRLSMTGYDFCSRGERKDESNDRDQ